MTDESSSSLAPAGSSPGRRSRAGLGAWIASAAMHVAVLGALVLPILRGDGKEPGSLLVSLRPTAEPAAESAPEASPTDDPIPPAPIPPAPIPPSDPAPVETRSPEASKPVRGPGRRPRPETVPSAPLRRDGEFPLAPQAMSAVLLVEAARDGSWMVDSLRTAGPLTREEQARVVVASIHEEFLGMKRQIRIDACRAELQANFPLMR